MATPFEIATTQRDTLEALMRDATATLREITDQLAGDTPRVMGLTPDHVKANPDWQQAKAAVDALFQALRTFNRFYVSTFKRELSATRNTQRRALTR